MSDGVRRFVGNLLVSVGLLLLASTGALWAYGELERGKVEAALAEQDVLERATATAEALSTAVAAAQEVGFATATAVARSSETPAPLVDTPSTATPGAAPPPTTAMPTSTPVAVTIRRITAPSIDLDASVVESRVVNGEWEVPRFVAGYLVGTGIPGRVGNVVLSGHVQSLTSGNVFARLNDLKIGDEVVLRTTGGELRYRLTGKNIVLNNDVSVLDGAPGKQEITLITCYGTFNPLTNDYSQRLVVWGERVA